MGDTRVTQEAASVLASIDAAVRSTQEAVSVMAEPVSGSTRTTLEATVILANPLGTITTVQEAINVLGTPESTVEVTQTALNILGTNYGTIYITQQGFLVLADYETTTVIDPQDPDITNSDGDIVALTDTLSTIRTLIFSPSAKTRYLLLAQCAAGVTYNDSSIDACQTVLGQSALLVNGTTVAFNDIGNLQTYYCLDAQVGQTYTVELKAARLQPGDQYAYGARITSIGLNSWYRIEQGVEATLSGPDYNGEKILMEDIIEPKFGQCLVFNYAEYLPDETEDLLRGTYTVEFDNSKLREIKPIDVVLSQRSAFQEDLAGITYGNRWSCISSASFIDFEGSKTAIKYKSSKLDSLAAPMSFRRLRTVIIPLSKNNFGAMHSTFSAGGDEYSGVETEALSLSPAPRTVDTFGYLVLANVKTHVSSGDGPIQTTFRYGGLGLAGTTAHMVGISGSYAVGGTTALASITFGITNDDILAVKTYNLQNDSIPYTGYNGQQYFGFNYKVADVTTVDQYNFFSGTQFQQNTPVVSRTGDRLLSVVQFRNVATVLTEDLLNATQEVYNKRTLVEINMLDTVYRYCLQEDIYLLDGFTSNQILELIRAGTIDEASAEDLTVTGTAVLTALNNGLDAEAESLLTLSTTNIQGVTTSTSSEYTTKSSIYKLYKQGILKDINVTETLPDASYGVIEVDNISAELYDDENVLLDNLVDLQGASIKVRTYDVITGEMRTIAYGTVNEVSVGSENQIVVSTGNPDTQALDSEFPLIKVSDLTKIGNIPGQTARLADDEAALVPVFFGKARRLLVPNIDKSYGTTTTTPEYLDAYSDYAIGGPLLNNYGLGYDGYFPYVVTDFAYVTTTGIYRQWLGITNPIEFENSETYQYDKFVYEDSKVPTFRFQAFQIDTITRSSVLDLPHTGTTTSAYDDIAAVYPNLTPVNNVLHVYGGYIKGRDWIQGSDGYSSSIKWGITAGFTEPPVSLVSTTTAIFTRGTPRDSADYLLNNDGETTAIFANILNVSSIDQYLSAPGSTQGEVVTYNSTYYGLESSNELRVFEDIVNWGARTSVNRLLLEFDGSLLDTNTSGTTNTFYTTGGQPYYHSDSCLEFINSETLGTVYGPYPEATGLGMNKRWALYAEVSANIDGELSGEVVSKMETTGDWEGYALSVLQQDAIYSDGVTTKYLPVFEAYYGGTELFDTYLVGSTSSAVNLLDGDVHSIMVVSLEINNDYGCNYLYVDNVLEDWSEDFRHSGNTAVAPFVIGGTTGYEFSGRIHRVSLDTRPRIEPLPGTTYSVTFDYQPDSYKAEWDYIVSSASNPIQYVSSDQPYVIAGDFKVNGADLVPSNDYVLFSGITNSMYWNKYGYSQGYAAVLNNPSIVGADGLGTVVLEDPTQAVYERDFCIYGASKWIGDTAEAATGDFICKPFSATEPSYMIGLTNGYPFARIRTLGGTSELLSTAKVNDGKVHFYMLERDGYNMHLYVDQRRVATGRVSRSREATDYNSDYDVIVGGTTVTGSQWKGDVLFVGACNYSPGSGFAALQSHLLESGIKGQWVQRSSSNSSYRTQYHIPFIEGIGITCSSRNLARNASYNIKRLLSDGTFGVGDKVDGASFDLAAKVLDDANVPIDFVTRGPRKLADILKDICLVRGIHVRKNGNNRWVIGADSEDITIAGAFGLNDTYYNNIVSVGEYRLKSLEDRVKKVVLKYRYMPNSLGELEYLASVSRDVLSGGVQVQEVECPYILEHETADKCVDYLAKRLRYSSTILNIEVGQEGRNLQIGDIVLINIPHLNIVDGTFKISKIGYNVATIKLDMEEYSTEIFNYSPGTYPDDEAIPVGDAG